MGRFSSASSRNFGFGKQLAYAAHNSLQDSFCGGHFETVAAHSSRFKKFSQFAKKSGISDAQKITNDLLRNYAEHLKNLILEKDMSIKYAQNLLSTVNVTMQALRSDKKIKISPSIVGKRVNVRTQAPLSMDRKKIDKFNPDIRSKCVFSATRELGIRKKEAVLLNYKQALDEAKRIGKIRITQGTKGGRGKFEKIKRFVPVSEEGLIVLKNNSKLQGDRNNLICDGESWKSVEQKLNSTLVRREFKSAGLGAYHDARSAYACERYFQITGYDAPAVAGVRLASKIDDRRARTIIAKVLGHNRIDICVSYVGSSK